MAAGPPPPLPYCCPYPCSYCTLTPSLRCAWPQLVDAPAVFRQLRIVFTMISGGGPVPDPAVLADDSLTSDGPASAALHLPLLLL